MGALPPRSRVRYTFFLYYHRSRDFYPPICHQHPIDFNPFRSGRYIATKKQAIHSNPETPIFFAIMFVDFLFYYELIYFHTPHPLKL